MITLKAKAGLGNQMFQYAYARALAIKNKTDLVIDTSWYGNISSKDTSRIFLLDKFNINATIQDLDAQSNLQDRETDGQISVQTGGENGGLKRGQTNKISGQNILSKIWKKIQRKLFGKSDYIYYEKLANLKDGSVVEGYWNTDKYFRDFKDVISKELTLKSPLSVAGVSKKSWIDDQISEGKNLILMHVRRGDYATNPNANKFHGLIDSKYYKQAIQRIASEYTYMNRSNTTFVISTDDALWTKENVEGWINMNGFETYWLSDNQIPDYEEMQLMSLCHHYIIANSTFSWWPAWLSKTAKDKGLKKIVVAPRKWVSNPKIDTKDVLPEEWIKI